MNYEMLDTVVLVRDLPDDGLRSGDLGAIVEVYANGELEVEFVTASGKTKALVSVPTEYVRPIADTDLVAVRSLDRSA